MCVNGLRFNLLSLSVCLGLGLATMALYLPLLKGGFVNYDDDIYVTQNPLVSQGFSWRASRAALNTCYGCNWHPVTTFSHMLDCQVYGLKPAGHHLSSILLHASNVMLLLLLLNSLTGKFWRSAMVAALFAWHPAHVESVAWIAERKDVLSSFFALLSLLAYTRYVHVRARPAPHWGSCLWYGVALLFFALGLMSKPMVVTLPFLMLLLDFWPLARFGPAESVFTWRKSARLILEKSPFFLLSAVSCLVTFWVQKHGGAVESLEVLPLTARVTNSVVAYVQYVMLMLYPHDLAVLYPHPRQHPWLRVLACAVGLIGGTVAALRQVRQRPYILIGWLWFLGMLVPVIGLVQVGDQAMADRYTYLPYVGLFIAAVWGAVDLAGDSRLRQRVAVAAGILALLACAIVTERQLRHWKNSVTLFSHAVEVTQNNAWAELNLGCALFDLRQYDAAQKHFVTAQKLKPQSAMVFLNLGKVQDKLGDLPRALEFFQEAVAYGPKNSEIHFALANTYMKLDRLDDAAAHYQLALSFNPNNAALQCDYGLLLARLGDASGAIARLNAAVRLKPSLPVAQMELGNLYAKSGKTEDAIAAYRRGIMLLPTNEVARLNLGGLMEWTGKNEEALSLYREAVKLNPDSARARSNLGVLLAKEGKAAEAEIQFQRFVELEPTNAGACYNLGNALLAQGKFKAAASQYSQTLALDPRDADAAYKLALCQARQGEAALAVESYRKTLQINPNHPAALIDLAWMLAAHPNPEIRNGREAVKWARFACQATGFEDLNARAALDVAFAEAGQFDEASEAVGKTRTLALAVGQTEMAEAAAKRQALYREHQPFHLP